MTTSVGKMGTGGQYALLRLFQYLRVDAQPAEAALAIRVARVACAMQMGLATLRKPLPVRRSLPHL